MVVGGVEGSGGNVSDGKRWGAVGSDGERQMKLRSLARRSPPDVRASSEQATDRHRSTAQGLGTSALQ